MQSILSILEEILSLFESFVPSSGLGASLQMSAVYLAIIAGGAIILLLIPNKFLSMVFDIFSLGEFGMHYSKRKRDNIDDLGRFFMFITFVFCICFSVIPMYNIFYGILLVFAFLCTMGQTTRVTKDLSFVKQKLVVIGVYLMFAVGIIGALGLTNGNAVGPYVKQVMKVIAEKKYMDPYFYFTEPTFAMVALQATILYIPFYCMWAQFIYMRLEDTYKARWMVTWVLKIALCCIIMFTLPAYGFNTIKGVYNIEEKEA